ncbi:Metal-dependent hydrolase, endonuclease/exonuclease/phosphatase family [Pontibacter lucknowensis]|uniref:Metal-dependent hydrolase, endonuclease/exonuclease/phosphatase family n=2 Tax=Pontibacter TaxID=323449 RepID=A0A1N6XAB9_9BACT|nr:Metal-dependent hydrolase, endonuclease/exonuclease/phosphatase family [Pontibacter lucknowensis]
MDFLNSILPFLLCSVLLTACVSKSPQGMGDENTEKAASQLRIMSYNIHHANPPGEKGVIDLEAIAGVIRSEEPDLVALQEVDVHIPRSGNVHQAEALAAMLGMHFYFAKAIDFGGGEYGVAILSRYPLSDTRKVELPKEDSPKAEGRVLAVATVQLPGGQRIRFGSTHLDIQSSANRQQQVQTIIAVAAADQLPFILAGDLNDYPDSPAIATLDETFQRTCLAACEATFPQDKPDRIIDYIAFTRSSGLAVRSHRVVPESYASDHRPVVAVLGLSSAPGAFSR